MTQSRQQLKAFVGMACLSLNTSLLMISTNVYACDLMNMKHNQLFDLPISPWTYVGLIIMHMTCISSAFYCFDLGLNLKVRPKNYILPLCALFLAGLSFWTTVDIYHSKEFHLTRSLFMDLPVTTELSVLSFIFFIVCLYMFLTEMGSAGICYPKKKAEDDQTPTE